jgi:hypothetical protein
MQDLWAKGIVDSISTALCFFLHSDLICYVNTIWSIFRLEYFLEGLLVVDPGRVGLQ